jgi:ethanolamine utilization protein EutQ (cupin superfamily)
MIKMEVDSRLSSDKETKSLIQSLIKNVMQEIVVMKEQSDKTLQKLAKDVKDT